MDARRLYKLAKSCGFNYQELIDKFIKTPDAHHQLRRLADAYPHLRYSIMDFFQRDPDIPMWVGNEDATKRLLTAMIQGRLVILAGPPGSGKTYYIDHKIRKLFHIIHITYSSESMRRLETEGQIGSLQKRRRVFVIDPLDKITAKHIKRFGKVASKVKCGVIVVTNKKKIAKTPPHIEVVNFKTISAEDRLVALSRYFPLKSEKEIKAALQYEHLGRAIRFLETGVAPREELGHVTTFFYIAHILFMGGEYRRHAYNVMLEQKPNPTTLLIYLADQAQLSDANREIVTKIIQRHAYNIRPNILYAELAFGLIKQEKFFVDQPDTITRRKWNKKKETKKKPKKAPKIPRQSKKKPKKQRSIRSGGLGRFRGKSG